MHHLRTRILPLIIAFTVSIPMNVSVSAANADTTASELTSQSIDNLTERGIIKKEEANYYQNPENPLTRSDAASLLYEAFCLVPVFSMEAPVTVNEDGAQAQPVSKSFYSTNTTVATLDSALLPAAPDTVGTDLEAIANTVLEARLMDQIDGTFQGSKKMTRKQFALSVMKAVYGADKEIDFLSQGEKDGLLPVSYTHLTLPTKA